MTVTLYAEHLHHIRALSIQATLSTDSNTQTRATLSADGKTLTLTHEEDSASIVLPINIPPSKHSDATLTIPPAPTRDISFRVQLEEREGASGLLGGKDGETLAVGDAGDEVPWGAKALTGETEMGCAGCGAVVVERGRVKEWRDLPSEGWAEMMEFWHCHKPEEPEGHQHDGAEKGYAAGSRLALQSGVGFVGTMEFLLHPDDCGNVETATSVSTAPTPISCKTCSQYLGAHSRLTGAHTLRKPALSLSLKPSSTPVSHPKENWLAAHLLHASSVQGTRKFTAHSVPPKTSSTTEKAEAEPPLKLTILTPILALSSSLLPAGMEQPLKAMKVLYRSVEAGGLGESVGALNEAALAEGELEMGVEELRDLRAALEKGRGWMPVGARTVGVWGVGVLGRF